MDLQQFYSSMDKTLLTLSFGWFSIYIGIYFSLFQQISDLEQIKKKAIYKIINQSHSYEVVEFINDLYERSKVLVLPAERSGVSFKISLWSFLAASIIGVIFDGITQIIGVR